MRSIHSVFVNRIIVKCYYHQLKPLDSLNFGAADPAFKAAENTRGRRILERERTKEGMEMNRYLYYLSLFVPIFTYCRYLLTIHVIRRSTFYLYLYSYHIL